MANEFRNLQMVAEFWETIWLIYHGHAIKIIIGIIGSIIHVIHLVGHIIEAMIKKVTWCLTEVHL